MDRRLRLAQWRAIGPRPSRHSLVSKWLDSIPRFWSRSLRLTYVAKDGLAKVSHLPGKHGLSASPRLVLSDLSVEPAKAPDLATSRLIASVDVRLPATVRAHRGTREFLRHHLEGRNPVIFEEDGYLRIAFAVADLEPRTLDSVQTFASELGALLNTDSVDCRTMRLPA